MPATFMRLAMALAIGMAAVLTLLAAADSLSWRYEHDAPLMIYAGWLIAQGAIPYRDFFDMNMPGTYLVMMIVGRVVDWSDLGFRVFDLLCLASISTFTFLWMRRFGILAALAGSVAFPLWHLVQGHNTAMQREFMALVPFTAMLALSSAEAIVTIEKRTLFAGVVTGTTMLIKPQFLILSLPVLAFLLREGRDTLGVRRRIVILLGGMSLPLGAGFLYLLHTGGLGPFVDLALNYWPLYGQLTGWHEPIGGLRRLVHILQATQEGLMTFYAAMAVVGLTVLTEDRLQRPHAAVVGGLLAAAAIYPALSGQFWPYHWIPFHYAALCAASLAARAIPISGSGVLQIAPAVAVLFLMLSLSFMSTEGLRGSRKEAAGDKPPKGGVPDEVYGYLQSRLKTDDAVQPLDWTGGAVHGMLMARATLATRFMYDFHFYHHISSPYIAGLRREFMNGMRAKQPRWT